MLGLAWAMPALLPAQSLTDDPDMVRRIRFQRQVLPLLADRCFACHGPDEAANESGLRLDVRSSAVGDLAIGPGRAIVPGQPNQSVLLRRVAAEASERMPPPDSHKPPLTASEIQLLRAWIADGANYEVHWSFQPLPDSVAIPEVPTRGWARNPIDQFIFAELQKQQMAPAVESERWRWLRRVSLDLTGLPPTPAAIREFLGDAGADAHERVVDRLLASPHFGQHQAISWLDLARYADSYGYQSDLLCNVYPYRDWVVAALNRNLPYDQFLTQQLAGDLLPNATAETQIATAFNRLHRQTNEGGSIDREWRLEYAADRVKTFGTAMLGLTLECARCHDHKYDPITTRDFYSLTAFFNSIDEFGTYNDSQHIPTPTLMLPSPDERAAIDAARAEWAAATLQWTIYEETVPQRYNEWLLADGKPVPRAPFAAFSLDARDDQAHFPNHAPARASDVAARWDAAKPRVDRPTEETQPVDPARNLPPSELLATSSPNNATIAGRSGSGLALTGDDAVSIPAFPLTVSQPFTVAFWLRMPANPPIDEAMLWHQTSGTDTGFSGTELKIVNGRLQFSMQRFWPGNALAIATDQPVAGDRWVSIVASYDGLGSAAGMKLYVAGQAKHHVVRNELSKSPASGDRIAFGERFRTRGPTGAALDDLALFDSVLSPAEVMALSTGREITDIWPQLDEAARQQFFVARIDPRAAEIRHERQQAIARVFAAQDRVLELMVMRELPEPRPTFIKPRGQYDAPETKALRVERAVPAAMAPLATAGETPTRLDLAAWLVSPSHPLTARVAVNRVWQNFFGQGLVETVEDWGVQGTPPSHPQLLDWLARDFVEHGWDYKRLCRTIVLSATYRQTSIADPALRERDPKNQWLARGPARRLSAEMLRDLALFASGLLDDRLGGPPVSPYQPEGLWTENNAFSPGYRQSSGDDLYRRSLYSIWKRTAPLPNMVALDAVDRETCVARRTTTNTPLAAFVLLNDPQFIEASNRLAFSLATDRGLSDIERGEVAFLKLIGRAPTARENEIALAMLAEQRRWFQANQIEAETLLRVGSGTPPLSDGTTAADVAAWSVVVQTVFNSDGCVWSR